MKSRHTLAFLVAMLSIASYSPRVSAVEYKVALLPYDVQSFHVSSTDGINFGGNSCCDVPHAIILDGRLDNLVNLNPEGHHSSVILNVSGEHQVGWANETTVFIGERATLWNGTAKGAVDLHPDRFQYSRAVDVSGDYQVGNGFLQNGFSVTALLWNGTAESVVELTPQGFGNSVARAISGDSQVGYVTPFPPNAIPRAVLWHGTAESFVDLQPTGYSYTDAVGVSGDVQVGSGIPPGGALGVRHALMWRGTAESFEDLHPAGFDGSYAVDVAGNVVVGGVVDFEGEYAFAWHGTAESGVDLHSYLEDLGPQYTYSHAFSVTDDGTIFGGTNGNIAVWTPIAACDFDQDGACAVGDVDALVGEIITGTNAADFDLSADGVVNNVDLNLWLADASDHNGFAAPYIIGDANLDGTVDALDLNALGQNWLLSPNTWTSGDFNADGVANAIDLNELGQNWLATTSTAATMHNVPEPQSTGILLFGFLAIVQMLRPYNVVRRNTLNADIQRPCD